MATHSPPEEQLLELLLTLKRTTPNEAKTILNSQPQIAYALMAMMVNINAVKTEIVQETLAKYGALPGASGTAPAPAPPSMLQQPPSAIPPHIQAQIPPRGGTPTYPHGAPGGYPPPSYSSGPPPPGRGYNTPPPGPGQPPGYGPSPGPGLPHGPGPHAQPPPHGPLSAQALPHTQLPHAQQPPSGPAAPVLPEALAALPEEQKALIMRVIAMSREEVYQMPPAERENIIKLRTTLGLPT
ncbi:hypothetical protein C8Q74DRAFT_1238925 [Fomes fomentarius]|nr:hypothetical protein C8Q74DRAFT_1238925 [Fomes fomentarius]